MIGLLRAEWLRLRKRRDIWLVALALVALSIPAYFSGVSNVLNNAGQFPADMPPDVIDQIKEQARQELLRYAFPLSIGTVLQNGQILILALVAYLAAAVTGAEFAYGTIRTSLVAHADRRGFLMVRLAAMAVVALMLVALLVVLGALLPLVAGLLGTILPGVADPDIGRLVGFVAVTILATCFVVGLTTLWAILMRNAAIALVLTIAYVLIEGAVVGLIVRVAGEQSMVRWLPPVADLQVLFDRAGVGSMGAQIGTPLAISVGIAWVLATWAVSVRLLARADIRE
jgi:ABC-type transport system involved in multi-copper enzyme maturation permease subunit